MKYHKHAAIRKAQKRYTPDRVIVNYFEERLRLDLEIENRVKEGKAALPEYAGKDASLRRRKHEVLNRAFQAMVDLTYMIEEIAESQRLQELFGGDLLDLFGLRAHALDWDDPHSKIVFGRLIEATLNMCSSRGKDAPDHAMKLAHIAQMKIFEKMHDAARADLKAPGSAKIVTDDILRAVAWSEEFALRHQGDYDSADRILDIPKSSR